jgi:flagellar hook-basal body complex protein FliE
MANLNVENLSRIVQSGDGEELFSNSAASEFRTLQEMKNQGMKTPDAAEAHATQGSSFSDLLRTSVNQVNTLQVQADDSISNLVAGRTKNIHETMLAIERADSSLKLMMQVRNKILDAYKEIMRMQV